ELSAPRGLDASDSTVLPDRPAHAFLHRTAALEFTPPVFFMGPTVADDPDGDATVRESHHARHRVDRPAVPGARLTQLYDRTRAEPVPPRPVHAAGQPQVDLARVAVVARDQHQMPIVCTRVTYVGIRVKIDGGVFVGTWREDEGRLGPVAEVVGLSPCNA